MSTTPPDQNKPSAPGPSGNRPPQKGRPRRPIRPSGQRPGPNDPDNLGPRRSNNFLFIFLVVLSVALFIAWKTDPENTGSSVSYDFFLKQVESDNVTEVRFVGQVLTGEWKKVPEHPEDADKVLDKAFNTVLPTIDDDALLPVLKEHGVKIDSTDIGGGIGGTLMFLAVPLMFIGFLWFMMRRSSDPMSGGMFGNFVRSPAKRFEATDKKTTFKDVAGMKQAKRELEEIVEFLKNPEKFHKLGAVIPKGVLLMGAPGNGKTLLARATAGEADVPFYSVSGSEFIQMFVGVGASRVRDLFQNANENAPAIMFIDEIDAVGRVRGAGVGGGHDEREQTLNQILSEMDGFEATSSVIVMAATNRPDVLDPALLRPGRFDRHITVSPPTREGREGVLKVHSKNVPLAEDVSLEELAKSTIGFSGAELKNLVNEAALIASRSDRDVVNAADFDAAMDRVTLGPEREENIDDYEREMTAYHEAGHALVGWMLPECDPVHKVTIVPRGRAAGITAFRPDEEKYHVGERRVRAELAMALGGRAADKLIFEEASAGAESDIARATSLARKMVTKWGMSDVIGPVAYSQGEEHPFLGKEMHAQREFSEESARIIDEEVLKILREASAEATRILEENRSLLDELTQRLLDEENLDHDQVKAILGERPKPHRITPVRSVSSEADNQSATDDES